MSWTEIRLLRPDGGLVVQFMGSNDWFRNGNLTPEAYSHQLAVEYAVKGEYKVALRSVDRNGLSLSEDRLLDGTFVAVPKWSYTGPTPTYTNLSEAAGRDELAMLAESRAKLLNEIGMLADRLRWRQYPDEVPVGERSERFLAWAADEARALVLSYAHGRWWPDHRVTHWMPLPEPPNDQ